MVKYYEHYSNKSRGLRLNSVISDSDSAADLAADLDTDAGTEDADFVVKNAPSGDSDEASKK